LGFGLTKGGARYRQGGEQHVNSQFLSVSGLASGGNWA